MLSLQDVLELAFSIVHDVEEYCLNFVAPTRYEVSWGGTQCPRCLCHGTAVRGVSCVCPWGVEATAGERWALHLPRAGARDAHALLPQFCLWTDGLNVLLGKEMTSERTQTDLDVLLSMELKLRLLDLENISIPDDPPPIPKPPSNLNFCYDFSHAEQ